MNANKAPLHLWVVGALSLAWNAFGAYDYVMTESRNEAYLAMFTPELRAFFDSFPAWAVAAWAIAVWDEPGVPGDAFGRSMICPTKARGRGWRRG